MLRRDDDLSHGITQQGDVFEADTEDEALRGEYPSLVCRAGRQGGAEREADVPFEGRGRKGEQGRVLLGTVMGQVLGEWYVEGDFASVALWREGD